MKNAADWVKILYTYGPFAILVFLVFVGEKKSRIAMKEAAQSEERVMLAVYVVNWLVIFGLVIYSVIAWKQINIDRTPEIRGSIENISNSEVLSSNFADLYLHRIRQDNDRYSNYEWLLLNKDKRTGDGATIVFTIDASKADSENICDYELPISMDFYDKPIRLWRDKDNLYLSGQTQPLSKRARLIGPPPNTMTKVQRLWDIFTTTVFAQSAQQSAQSSSITDLAVGLESPDAIVRREARADLARQNQAVALPWMNQVLQDSQSSYRLRLGVIVALNNMSNLQKESLAPETISAIQRALADSDQTLKTEAFAFARRYGLIPAVVYEDINYSGRSQGFGAGRYRADQGQLGYLPNDTASSVHVIKGFKVRLCENEGTGNGAGACDEWGEGWHSLTSKIADRVSYIQVDPVSGYEFNKSQQITKTKK